MSEISLDAIKDKGPPCHWTIENGKRYFIPGCMGAAVYGERGCTCDKSGIEKSSTWAIEKRIEKLEREIEEVKKELSK